MADPIKRTQTIHTNEQKRQSIGSSQWLLEKKCDTRPISDNSKLKVMICGEEGFADIAKEKMRAGKWKARVHTSRTLRIPA